MYLVRLEIRLNWTDIVEHEVFNICRGKRLSTGGHA